MAQNRTSKIWRYLSVEREDDVKAQCNHCTAKFVRGRNAKSFGTSSMLGHLRTKDSDMYRQLEAEKAAALPQRPDEPPAKKTKFSQETISAFTENMRPLQKDSDWARSIDKAIAVMISLDEQPFSVADNPGFKHVTWSHGMKCGHVNFTRTPCCPKCMTTCKRRCWTACQQLSSWASQQTSGPVNIPLRCIWPSPLIGWTTM